MNRYKDLDNVEYVLLALVKNLALPIKPELLLDELNKHPEYNGLLAISDVLHYFHIKNFAFEIPFDKLYQLPAPFIATTSLNGGEFVVVTGSTESKVTFSSQTTHGLVLDLEVFKGIYRGVSLVIQAYPENIEKSMRHNALIEKLKPAKRTILFILASLLLLGLVANQLLTNTPNIYNSIILFVIKSIGLVLAVLLLIYSFNSNNSFIQKSCKLGTNISCSDILNTNAARAFLGLSWSEIGLFYFAGTWSILIFYNGHLSTYCFLAFLNLCCIPYTFFSISYQAFIAKQWCLLCTSVQLLGLQIRHPFFDGKQLGDTVLNSDDFLPVQHNLENNIE